MDTGTQQQSKDGGQTATRVEGKSHLYVRKTILDYPFQDKAAAANLRQDRKWGKALGHSVDFLPGKLTCEELAFGLRVNSSLVHNLILGWEAHLAQVS